MRDIEASSSMRNALRRSDRHRARVFIALHHCTSARVCRSFGVTHAQAMRIRRREAISCHFSARRRTHRRRAEDARSVVCLAAAVHVTSPNQTNVAAVIYWRIAEFSRRIGQCAPANPPIHVVTDAVLFCGEHRRFARIGRCLPRKKSFERHVDLPLSRIPSDCAARHQGLRQMTEEGEDSHEIAQIRLRRTCRPLT